MKNFTISMLCVLAISSTSLAQTRPQQTLYLFNHSALNPAATGIEDYGQVRAGIRKQWVGVDGAPRTLWLSGDMRLGAKATSKDPHMVSKGHGVGVNLYYDEIGPYEIVHANIGYSYHLPLSAGLSLSAGFAGGINQTQLDLSKSTYPGQAVDPAVIAQADVSKKISPDLNAGLLLKGKNFFTGLSLMQLIPAGFVEAEESQSKYRMQLRGSLGYVFRFNEEGTSLWLSGIVNSDFGNPLRYDFMARLRYRNLGWIATSVRVEDALGLGLGLNITKNLSFGYLYEWGVDRHISTYSKGSHEAFLAFRFIKENGNSQPKMGW